MPIDISNLNRILSVNTETRTCTAELGVTFAELVKLQSPIDATATLRSSEATGVGFAFIVSGANQ